MSWAPPPSPCPGRLSPGLSWRRRERAGVFPGPSLGLSGLHVFCQCFLSMLVLGPSSKKKTGSVTPSPRDLLLNSNNNNLVISSI